MRRILSFAVLAGLAVALLLPCRAEACGGAGRAYGASGMEVLARAAAVVAVGDVALTVADLPTLLALVPPSAGYGVLEIVVAAPQLVVAIAGLGTYGGSGFFPGYTLWMAALMAHGIWSIAAAAQAPNGLEPRPAPAASRDSGARLQAIVGPTYVAVGQFSHAGFGLSGRF